MTPTSEETGEHVLQPLVSTGRIIPAAQYSNIPPISEIDLKAIVSNTQISGKPLSEKIIEERGEW
uniref:Uncharacterized protein n=1 Tax=Oscillatoriales cyanobacterium SpSt-402 TaxID=2282168 RepID=A0A832H2W5_9CYAN